MSERHELEMKAEEIFNMVFAPLGWDPDTEKAYYSVPDGMQGLVLDVLGVEY